MEEVWPISSPELVKADRLYWESMLIQVEDLEDWIWILTDYKLVDLSER
jgi:hypothetical protein